VFQCNYRGFSQGLNLAETGTLATVGDPLAMGIGEGGKIGIFWKLGLRIKNF